MAKYKVWKQNVPIPPTKVCTGPCGLDLPMANFSSQTTRKYWKKTMCKTCDRAHRREKGWWRDKESLTKQRFNTTDEELERIWNLIKGELECELKKN